jgi:hypothetical protein
MLLKKSALGRRRAASDDFLNRTCAFVGRLGSIVQRTPSKSFFNSIDPLRSSAGLKSRSAPVSCRTEVCYPFSRNNEQQAENCAPAFVDPILGKQFVEARAT